MDVRAGAGWYVPSSRKMCAAKARAKKMPLPDNAAYSGYGFGSVAQRCAALFTLTSLSSHIACQPVSNHFGSLGSVLASSHSSKRTICPLIAEKFRLGVVQYLGVFSPP